MHTLARSFFPVLLFVVRGASADVLDAGASGFTVETGVHVAAARDDVYSAFVNDIAGWWNPDLTVSGYAEAMYLDLRPMGCLCEALGSGSGIVHLTVTLVDTNNMLRFTGGLGPLGLLGVAGNMTVEFDDADAGSSVTIQYAVGGYRPGGLEDLAADVDAALAGQLARLKRYLETGSAADTDIAGQSPQ